MVKFNKEVISTPEKVIEIWSKKELINLKKKLGVRPSWHEPDEQSVEAWVIGRIFDNAGSRNEMKVVIAQDGEVRYQVNLAMLLAWATDYVDED